MHTNRYVILVSALLVVACSQSQPLAPVTVSNAVASNAVTVDLGVANGRTATIDIVPPTAAAHLKVLTTDPDPAPIGAHHWEAADISEYDVTLMRATTSNHDVYEDVVIGSPLTVPLPTTTVGLVPAKTKAIFAHLAQGQYYRAYVAAMGRQGGAVGVVGADQTFKQLNVAAADPTKFANPTVAIKDFTDFNFTDTQTVTIEVDHAVTIGFDGVDFSGTGQVTFGHPADGVFNSPGIPVSGTPTN